jgi:hypothetical protein
MDMLFLTADGVTAAELTGVTRGQMILAACPWNADETLVWRLDPSRPPCTRGSRCLL